MMILLFMCAVMCDAWSGEYNDGILMSNDSIMLKTFRGDRRLLECTGGSVIQTYDTSSRVKFFKTENISDKVSKRYGYLDVSTDNYEVYKMNNELVTCETGGVLKFLQFYAVFEPFIDRSVEVDQSGGLIECPIRAPTNTNVIEWREKGRLMVNGLKSKSGYYYRIGERDAIVECALIRDGKKMYTIEINHSGDGLSMSIMCIGSCVSIILWVNIKIFILYMRKKGGEMPAILKYI